MKRSRNQFSQYMPWSAAPKGHRLCIRANAIGVEYAACECGWLGDVLYTRLEVQRDGSKHIERMTEQLVAPSGGAS